MIQNPKKEEREMKNFRKSIASFLFSMLFTVALSSSTTVQAYDQISPLEVGLRELIRKTPQEDILVAGVILITNFSKDVVYRFLGKNQEGQVLVKERVQNYSDQNLDWGDFFDQIFLSISDKNIVEMAILSTNLEVLPSLQEGPDLLETIKKVISEWDISPYEPFTAKGLWFKTTSGLQVMGHGRLFEERNNIVIAIMVTKP